MQRIIKHIYCLPASITIITGYWKTGKTDWGLCLAELTRQMGIISECASNVETQDSFVKFMNDFANFDFWLYSSRATKMFLYDEVMESAPKRGAMTSLNVGWVRRIPQLSKGRCHLIALVQDTQYADSIFKNPIFWRGTWHKLAKTALRFTANWLWDEDELEWDNLPRTNLKFDPYLLATWKMEKDLDLEELPLPLKVLVLYSQDNNLEDIKEKLKLDSRTTTMRLLREGCRSIVTLLQQPSEGKKLLDSVTKPLI
jgi:hypothetical protein